MNQFSQQFPQKTFAKHQVILQAGDTGEMFFYIDSGAVKMTSTSVQGQNIVLHIFHPGSCFSLLSLACEGVHQHDFTALTETTVRLIPKEQLLEFLLAHPHKLYMITLGLLRGMNGLLHRIEQTSFVPAYNQLASVLLYFVKHFPEKEHHHNTSVISLRLTHQEIADWMGLTRENVSLQLKKMEHQGLIVFRDTDHFIEICDIDELKKLAEVNALD